MRALLYHANQFGFAVERPSERIGQAIPEAVNGYSFLNVEECLVALFHVEEGDGDHQIKRFTKDAMRIAQEFGTTRLVVAAFGHLSDSYPEPETALQISTQVVEICRKDWQGEFYTSPFGHDKTFVLNCKGHRGAIRFRNYRVSK